MRLKRHTINQTLLYPLRVEPIYQYRLWGGRHLSNLLTTPLPGDGPIDEACVLSDRDDHPSQVANGPFKGRTIGQLLQQFPEQLLGKLAHHFRRFPLLLKFLDAREMLSVQVHPSDAYTLQEMIYIGDALFVGGNDYSVEEAGVVSIPVRDPRETKRLTETVIACLADRDQKA
jgi:mannose-6-phosphate isomerase class I